MITKFQNKELEKFYTNGDSENLEGVNLSRLKIVLSQIDSAETLSELAIPSFKFTRIRKDGIYSISLGKGKNLIIKLSPAK